MGLLLDDEFIITRRKFFCQEYINLVEQGYEMHFLDETYVNSKNFAVLPTLAISIW